MADILRDYQLDAIERMQDGCILCGGVGSGKSRTALGYYCKEQGGDLYTDGFVRLDNPKDLYIITTARKRDTKEWEGELPYFLLTTDQSRSLYKHKIVVESWNNIQKFVGVRNAFFIFDEQRVVGYGAWTKSFLKICRANDWILLSATPGDKWHDYIPVFMANGFYRSKTEFENQHVVWRQFVKFRQVDRYLNVTKLIRLRDKILVNMEFARPTTAHHEDVLVKYNTSLYRDTSRTRTNPFVKGYIPCKPFDPRGLLVGKDILLENVTPIMEGWNYTPKDGDYVKMVNKPILNASELCYIWRKIVNTDLSRQLALLEIFEDHPRMIVFYNFDYERDILMNLYYGEDVEIAEWSGHAHQPVPDCDSWVYLVQYNAGAEGWNCIKTDTIVFFSQNYSYKMLEQAAGRIDRLNTPYTDLYYYHLKTNSGIDRAISKALKDKKRFNETRYVTRFTKPVQKEAT